MAEQTGRSRTRVYVAAAIILLIVIGIITYIAIRRYSANRDAAYDQAQQAAAAERQKLTEERDALNKRATDAEQHAATLEATVTDFEARRVTAVARETKTRKDLQDEDTTYQKALEATRNNTDDLCTRWLRACEKAKTLGLRDTSPCQCE